MAGQQKLDGRSFRGEGLIAEIGSGDKLDRALRMTTVKVKRVVPGACRRNCPGCMGKLAPYLLPILVYLQRVHQRPPFKSCALVITSLYLQWHGEMQRERLWCTPLAFYAIEAPWLSRFLFASYLNCSVVGPSRNILTRGKEIARSACTSNLNGFGKRIAGLDVDMDWNIGNSGSESTGGIGNGNKTLIGATHPRDGW